MYIWEDYRLYTPTSSTLATTPTFASFTCILHASTSRRVTVIRPVFHRQHPHLRRCWLFSLIHHSNRCCSASVPTFHKPSPVQLLLYLDCIAFSVTYLTRTHIGRTLSEQQANTEEKKSAGLKTNQTGEKKHPCLPCVSSNKKPARLTAHLEERGSFSTLQRPHQSHLVHWISRSYFSSTSSPLWSPILPQFRLLPLITVVTKLLFFSLKSGLCRQRCFQPPLASSSIWRQHRAITVRYQTWRILGLRAIDSKFLELDSNKRTFNACLVDLPCPSEYPHSARAFLLVRRVISEAIARKSWKQTPFAVNRTSSGLLHSKAVPGVIACNAHCSSSRTWTTPLLLSSSTRLTS